MRLLLLLLRRKFTHIAQQRCTHTRDVTCVQRSFITLAYYHHVRVYGIEFYVAFLSHVNWKVYPHHGIGHRLCVRFILRLSDTVQRAPARSRPNGMNCPDTATRKRSLNGTTNTRTHTFHEILRVRGMSSSRVSALEQFRFARSTVWYTEPFWCSVFSARASASVTF